MLGAIKKILGLKPKADFAALIAGGATVVDVRTQAEYSQGHLKKSVNIPLDQLSRQMKRIPKDRPVITCCASGMRSASARSLLQGAGYSEVYNGGSWSSLQQYMK